MIELKDNQRQYSDSQGMALQVKKGAADVFLEPVSDTRLWRSLFLMRVEAGGVIPHLRMRWATQQRATVLRLRIVAVGQTVLEEIPAELSQDREFLDTLEIPYEEEADGEFLLADALLYYYAAETAGENRIIRSTAEKRVDQRQRSVQRVAGLFEENTDSRMLQGADSEYPIYNAVRYLANSLKLSAAPIERVKAACAEEFTVEDVARLSGFICREVTLPKDWRKADIGPFLLLRKEQSPLVCFRHRGKLRYWDAVSHETGNAVRLELDMEQVQAYVLSRPLPPGKVGLKGILSFTLQELRIIDIVTILAGMGLASYASLQLTTLNQYLFDYVIPYTNHNMLYHVCIYILACMLGGLIFNISRALASFRMNSRIKYALQAAVYDRLFHLEESYFRKKESAVISYWAESMSGMYISCYAAVVDVVCMSVFSLMYVQRMHEYSPVLCSIGIWFVLLSLVFTVVIGWRCQKYQTEKSALNGGMRSFLFQALSSVSGIRAAGLEDEFQHRYMSLYSSYGSVDLRSSRGQRFSSAVIMAANSMALVLFFLLMSGNKLGITTGQLLAFISAFSALSGSMNSVAGDILRFIMMTPVLKNSAGILGEIPESSVNGIIQGNLEGDILLSNVSFSYNREGPQAVKNVSMQIEKGEYVAIVGPSGCGKSTLLRLMLGFEKPSSGQICYDGVSLERLSKPELRRKIGTVLQDGALLSGSILRNIRISCPGATMDQVRAAAEIACLTEDIEQMPLGFSTLISEQAQTVSGGQKQRILIARAVVSRPALLLMDEATSALDNVTQAKVSEHLAALNCTRIVVAHRLSTVRHCDRIYVMDQGSIAECGTYDQLMEKKGLFYQLARNQI